MRERNTGCASDIVDDDRIFTGLLVEDASSGNGSRLVGHTEVLKTSNSTGILGGRPLARC